MIDRLQETLASSGIIGTTINGIGSLATISYLPETTDEQRILGDSILSSFDWSIEADNAWRIQLIKNNAKDAVHSTEPSAMASRNSQKIVFGTIGGLINKLNELINAHNSKNNDTISLFPPARSWNDLVIALDYQIDNEQIG